MSGTKGVSEGWPPKEVVNMRGKVKKMELGYWPYWGWGINGYRLGWTVAHLWHKYFCSQYGGPYSLLRLEAHAFCDWMRGLEPLSNIGWVLREWRKLPR